MQIYLKEDSFKINNFNMTLYGIKNIVYQKYGVNPNHQLISLDGKYIYNSDFIFSSNYKNIKIIIHIKMF